MKKLAVSNVGRYHKRTYFDIEKLQEVVAEDIKDDVERKGLAEYIKSWFGYQDDTDEALEGVTTFEELTYAIATTNALFEFYWKAEVNYETCIVDEFVDEDIDETFLEIIET